MLGRSSAAVRSRARSGDVVVVGGGVIGLSIAYVLARSGTAVHVIDQGEPGGGASWAGAGMIAPAATRPGPGPLDQLRSRSSALYPIWARELQEATGVDVGYRLCGGLDLALNDGEAEELERISKVWTEQGVEYEWLDASQAREFEPGLGPACVRVAALPGKAQVRNPRLLRALAGACTELGARISAHERVVDFTIQGDAVSAVATESGPIACGTLVMAAGARSGGLLERLGIRLPTPPIKGEIVLLREDEPRLSRILEHGKRYLVPRGDGLVLAGATEVDAGFDSAPTAGGALELLDEAIRLSPGLAEAKVERAWAGLRPGSLDGLPTIGWSGRHRNVLIATGHFRGGIQLAPATAEAVLDLIEGGPMRVDVLGLGPDRAVVRSSESPAFRS